MSKIGEKEVTRAKVSLKLGREIEVVLSKHELAEQGAALTAATASWLMQHPPDKRIGLASFQYNSVLGMLKIMEDEMESKGVK